MSDLQTLTDRALWAGMALAFSGKYDRQPLLPFVLMLPYVLLAMYQEFRILGQDDSAGGKQ